MSKKLLLASCAFATALGVLTASSPVNALSVAAETDQEVICRTVTSCPNSSTQLCAVVHLTVMGAGVDYYCYQPDA